MMESPVNQASDTDLQKAIKTIRKLFDSMSEDDRLDAIDEMTKGYCSYCGVRERQSPCYCWNDD